MQSDDHKTEGRADVACTDLVSHPHTQNESDCQVHNSPNTELSSSPDDHHLWHKNAIAKYGDDGGCPPQSLQQLLGELACPITGAAGIRRLVKTPRAQDELLALVNPWKSLGRPGSVFWRETYVFYNRIVDSYELMANRYLAKPRFGLIREARLLLALSCG
jgi:hypothetical protein